MSDQGRELKRLRANLIAKTGREPTLYDETSWGLPSRPIVPVQIPPQPREQTITINLTFTTAHDLRILADRAMREWFGRKGRWEIAEVQNG